MINCIYYSLAIQRILKKQACNPYLKILYDEYVLYVANVFVSYFALTYFPLFKKKSILILIMNV